MAPTNWSIQPCALADVPALAHNNLSAFWTDPTWRQMWPMCTLPPFVIEQATLRMPRNLLNDRATLRHQKAVDPGTGKIMGYARWILPPSHAGDESWSEAQFPDASEEEKAAAAEAAESAWWHFNDEEVPLEVAMSKTKERLLAEREYMGRLKFTLLCWARRIELTRNTVLDYLAVHPDNWRKGIASALVASGLAKAKELNVDVFVLAFKAGYGVYKRMGLIEIDRVVDYDQVLFPGGDGEYGAYFFVSKVYGAEGAGGETPMLVEAEVTPVNSEKEAVA